MVKEHLEDVWQHNDWIEHQRVIMRAYKQEDPNRIFVYINHDNNLGSQRYLTLEIIEARPEDLLQKLSEEMAKYPGAFVHDCFDLRDDRYESFDDFYAYRRNEKTIQPVLDKARKYSALMREFGSSFEDIEDNGGDISHDDRNSARARARMQNSRLFDFFM